MIAHNQGRAMAVKCQSSFNSTSFLAKVGKGRSLGKYRKGQVVFSQVTPVMRFSTSRKAR